MQRLRFLLVLLALPVTAIAAVTVATVAVGQTCEWGNRRVESPPGYSFATSSWVRRESGGHRYYTCVENLVDRVLWFDWFIPGPSQYVLARQTVPRSRFFITRESQDINGCLEYGNHHAPMKQYFIGHAKDVPRANAEGDCNTRRRPTAEQPAGKGGLLEPLKSFFELFVATNADNAEKTLVHVTINSELSRVEETRYRGSLFLSAEPAAKDFAGNIADITMRSDSGVLQKALAGQEAQFARLADRERKPVTFEMKQSGDFDVDNAELRFYDLKGRFVGKVFIPVIAGQ